MNGGMILIKIVVLIFLVNGDELRSTYIISTFSLALL